MKLTAQKIWDLQNGAEWAVVQKSEETPVVSTVHHPLGTEGLWHTPDRHTGETEQLPAYIQNIAHALIRDQGMERSKAIAYAVNAVKRWARGELGWGKRKVTPLVQAAAKRALQEWEDLKQVHRGPGKLR